MIDAACNRETLFLGVNDRTVVILGFTEADAVMSPSKSTELGMDDVVSARCRRNSAGALRQKRFGFGLIASGCRHCRESLSALLTNVVIGKTSISTEGYGLERRSRVLC